MENERENHLTKPEIKRLQRMMDVQDKVRNLVYKLLNDAHIRSREFVLPMQLRFQKLALDIQKKADELLACYARESEYRDAESLQIRLNELSAAEDKLMDKLLIATALFEDQGLVKNELKEMFNHFRGICSGKYNSLDSLKKRTDELRALNVIHATRSIRASAEMLAETWKDFEPRLRGKDCYGTGYLGWMLNNGTDKNMVANTTRYHDNLDILVNEKDVERLIHELLASKRYNIKYNLNHKPGHAHTFSAIDNNGSVIKFHLFERNEDKNSICCLSYYYDREKGKTRCYYEELNDTLSAHLFNEEKHAVNNHYIYALKKRKDDLVSKYDLAKMDKTIDKDEVYISVVNLLDVITGTTSANSELIDKLRKQISPKSFKR